jgi:hypothetical protein
MTNVTLPGTGVIIETKDTGGGIERQIVALKPTDGSMGDVLPPALGAAGGVKIDNIFSQYETVAASQTAQVMGALGARLDYLAGVLVVPATLSPGNVLIRDGNGADIIVFAGGTSSVSDLRPFMIPLGLYAQAATAGGWRITTGANVSAIGIGKFT